MVLLFVTGIKSKEIRELSDTYNFFNISNEAFIAIIESYGTLYHQTYHGKKEKMLFSTYENLINMAYDKCYSALAQLDSLDRSFEQKDCVAKEILDLTKVIKQELLQIQEMIYAAKANGKDSELFTEVREMFYELQHKVYCVYPKCSKKVKQAQMMIERTQTSFL